MIEVDRAKHEIAPLPNPWLFLPNDDNRTPIESFAAPVGIPRNATSAPTQMHADYFGVASDFKRWMIRAAANVLASASSATPVDNEFWSAVFPSSLGEWSRGTVCLIYVSHATSSPSKPELWLMALPDEYPAVQMVFSARRTFVPAELPGLQHAAGAITGTARSHTNPHVGRAIALGTSQRLLALPSPTPQVPHVAAFQGLRDALRITDDELAEIVGVGRTTPYKWSREGSSPKPKTLRLLLRLDAIVRGLLASRNRADFDEWLLLGNPAPAELLRRREIDEFERRAHAAVFSRVATPSTGYDIEGPALPSRAVSRPAIARRPAKVSLRKRDR